jgi:hypothetical protein
MATSKATISSQDKQKIRDAYRQARRQRWGTRADLVIPKVDGIVDPVDGTLHKDVLSGATLDITLEEWDEFTQHPGDFDHYYLRLASGANDSDGPYHPIAQGELEGGTDPFPLIIKVPIKDLIPGLDKPGDGPYRLQYEVMLFTGQTTTSRPFQLIFDSTPPRGNLEPDPMTLPTTELTDAFLGANPGGMVAELPDYTDWKPGDKVAFYWLTPPLPAPGDPMPAPVGTVVVGAATGNTVTFPIDLLEASLDQEYYVAYFLFDKATNRSRLSLPQRIDVALGPLPDNLQLPEVPLAPDPEKLINLVDARLGVDVHILRFDNWKATDRIQLTWGTKVAVTREIGPSPTFPIAITVPRLILRDEYDKQLGGEQSTNVSYKVLRGVKESAVQAINVNVDFSFIGPDPVPDPDPDWPDPVNPVLLPVDVFGKISGKKNELDETDEQEAARLEFELYDPLNEDEVIDFFWGGQEVPQAQYTVLATDNPKDKIISQEIPWTVVETERNNPALPVHYEIHAPGSENTQHSDFTFVNVHSITIRPDEATFLGLSSTNYLICDSLYADPVLTAPDEPGIRVQIPDLSQYLKAGDTVTLNWIALQGRDGETPISGTEKEVVKTLDATTLEGFVWLVEPYHIHILPTYNGEDDNVGRARVTYSFELNGETVTSKVAEKRVAMFDGNGICGLRP